MPAHLPPSREQHAPPRLAQLDGVDAALDKWSGREERMFTALNKIPTRKNFEEAGLV